MVGEVDRGRDAFDRRAWGRAYDHLVAAAEHGPLDVEDLERLACAAYVTGRNDESSEVWAKAHQESAQVGDIARATRSAFWLAFSLLNDGQVARGGGWIDRAQRLLDERGLECVEQGYLRYASALRAIFSGDGEAAYGLFHEAAGIGERFRDPELTTLARIGEGRCLIYGNEIDSGIALLDEAMVSLGENEVSVIAAGDSYCTAIEGCRELFDVGRTAEWTAALSHWCDTQPDLVLYRGQCLIHRAEILMLAGTWDEAIEQVNRAYDRLVDPPGQQALGAASCLRGDIHRLRGELADAERAYLEAGALGCDPQPGLALLRCAQGQLSAGDSAIRRALAEAEGPLARARLLGPFVEIT
ncbi:MAG: tetratricopeptide repeat protein, partial [Acidimicrobiales bacterium]